MLFVMSVKMKKILLLTIGMVIVLILLAKTGIYQTKQQELADQNRYKANKAMEMILKDARTHAKAQISADSTIILKDDSGMEPVIYSQNGQYLVRNGKIVMSGISAVKFIRASNVIEIQIRMNSGELVPPMIVFATAKPGLGIQGN